MQRFELEKGGWTARINGSASAGVTRLHYRGGRILEDMPANTRKLQLASCTALIPTSGHAYDEWDEGDPRTSPVKVKGANMAWNNLHSPPRSGEEVAFETQFWADEWKQSFRQIASLDEQGLSLRLLVGNLARESAKFTAGFRLRIPYPIDSTLRSMSGNGRSSGVDTHDMPTRTRLSRPTAGLVARRPDGSTTRIVMPPNTEATLEIVDDVLIVSAVRTLPVEAFDPTGDEASSQTEFSIRISAS